MKRNCWLVLGTLFATAAVAQVNTNSLPPIPAPANLTAAPAPAEPTNAPAAPAKKKTAHKAKKPVANPAATAKPAQKINEPATALVPGTAKVVPPNLNLRGQAGLKGEVVGHSKAGDMVTVVSEITLDKHAAGEPAQWAKILLPAGTKGWINTHFVDASNNVVAAKKLNLRAGPSENYSVIGLLQKGDTYNPLTVKGDWIQIDAPTNSFAFVAAMYLVQETVPPAPENSAPAPAVVAAPAPVPPVPAVTNNVAEAPPIVAQPAPVPVPAPEPAPAMVPEIPTNTAAAVVDTNPPPPRIATHEGYVRPSISPIAPTYYELFDWGSGRSINYLHSPTTNLDLSHYNGYKIIVTGEEGMAELWPATPVLTVRKIYVTATNYPASDNKTLSSPRASSQRR